MQILQVLFLQDLQDLALNLANLALIMKLFLQDEQSCKNLARKTCKIIFLQDYDQILHENYLTISLARKASFLVQDMQDLVQDLAMKSYKKNTCKIWIFLARRFYWERNSFVAQQNDMLIYMDTSRFYNPGRLAAAVYVAIATR